jgi:hypothetical protein
MHAAHVYRNERALKADFFYRPNTGRPPDSSASFEGSWMNGLGLGRSHGLAAILVAKVVGCSRPMER